MTNFERFATPAHQGPKNYQTLGLPDSELQAFQQGWSDNINGWTNMGMIGNPRSAANDAPRAGYFNPLANGSMGPDGVAVVAWEPFPNRLVAFLNKPGIVQGGQLTQVLSLDEIYALADTGT